MPKIKVQIEADDNEFSMEDLENFLYELQQQLSENAADSDSPSWKLSIVGKNGSLTPVASDEDFDEEGDDEDFYGDYDDEDDDE